MLSDSDHWLMVLIPGLPLLAVILTAAFGCVLKERAHLPALVLTPIAFVLSLFLLLRVYADLPATAFADAHGNAHAAEQHELSESSADAETDEPADATSTEEAEETAQQFPKVVKLWTWMEIPAALPWTERALPLDISITLRADALTAVMLVTVTFVSMLVVIYSVGYMHDDPGYWRYFTYISLFIFSMIILVSASNFVLLYAGWEAVGLCSYLLIGFWYKKPEAAAAGKKAFLVNRVGDAGFALGIFMIWTVFGTLNFHDTVAAPAGASGQSAADTLVVAGETEEAEVVSQGVFGPSRLNESYLDVAPPWQITAICLLLFIGACGKSAQFPLHIWLPDAMEGPTPVSALIHAATMVTAGVYMVTRCAPLYMGSPQALHTVAIIGGFTALLAALIALTQNDLKRVLAYSTISQLGYMFLGLGTGTVAGMAAGMFHLFTHAFFKALLFLGAGSVMHAMGGVIDMRRFGGLRHRMPTTFWTFAIGSLALAGLPGLSGFFSKDEILVAVYGRSLDTPEVYGWLYYLAAFTAFLTAFYTMRAFFLTFYGDEEIPHEAGDHAHESPRMMTVPLMVLAVGAFGVGLVNAYAGGVGLPEHAYQAFIETTPSLVWAESYESQMAAKMVAEGVHATHDYHHAVMFGSAIVALLGIGLAAFLYLGGTEEVRVFTRLRPVQPFYRLFDRKFYLDEIYYGCFVWPLRLVANLSSWFDRSLLDGAVDLTGWIPKAGGWVLRYTGTGIVQFYALAMVVGILVLVIVGQMYQ